MTLAERTRQAAREQPFIYDALEVGALNYTATARYLDVEGEVEAVATALRRYAESLDSRTSQTDEPRADGPEEDHAKNPSVTVHRGTGVTDTTAQALVTVGETGLVPGEGSLTVVLAVGALTVETLEHALGRLRVAEIAVEAAASADGSVAIVVPDRDAATALRLVEDCIH